MTADVFDLARAEPVQWDRIEQIGTVLHTLNDWEIHLVTLLTLQMLAARRNDRWIRHATPQAEESTA